MGLTPIIEKIAGIAKPAGSVGRRTGGVYGFAMGSPAVDSVRG